MAVPTTLLARSVHGRPEALAAAGALGDGSSPGGLALVGEAGIGKSRLVAHAAQAARAARRVVVEGRATLGIVEPLGAFVDLVRDARRQGLSCDDRDPLARGFPAQLLPELGAGAVEAANLGATFEAAARYLEGLGRRRGALAVLEDLHWADGTSLSLVPYLARRLRAGRTGLLLTFRPEEPEAGQALPQMRAELRRERLVSEIVLEPLSAEAVAGMLAEVLGRPPTSEVERELNRLAAGNPFALEELVRGAVETGWLDAESGRRRGDGSVTLPWTLADSIRARAARLDPDQRDLLAWLAAVGERADLRLVARASGIDEDQVLVRAESLIRAGMLVAAPGGAEAVAFRHALVHEALASDATGLARAGRLRRVLAAADALAADGRVVLTEAEQARLALGAGDRVRALEASRAAARRAEEIGAVEEAVAYLERAVSLWDPDDGTRLRADLLLACGRLRARTTRGDPETIRLLSEARRAFTTLGDRVDAAWCASLIAEVSWQRGGIVGVDTDWESATATLRQAGRHEALRGALAAQAGVLASTQDHRASRAAAEEGLTLVETPRTAEEARDRTALLAALGVTQLFRADLEAGRSSLEEAAELALDHHDDVGAARAKYLLATANLLLVPADEARELISAAVDLVARHGLSSLSVLYVAAQAWPAVRAGQRDAIVRAQEGARLLLDEGAPNPIGRWVTAELTAELLLHDADLAGCEGVRLQMLSDEVVVGNPHMANYSYDGAALARLLGGDPAGARTLIDPALHWYLDLLDRDDAEVETVVIKVQVLVAAGELATAARLATWAQTLLPDHPQIRYCAGLLRLGDDPDGGADAIERAAGGTADHGWYFVAATDLMVAAGIAAAAPEGRPAAVRLTRSARARFDALGCEGWVRRADDSLRSLGERSPARQGQGAGGLSGRELEVLRLVAEGLTNRQIAERLVISEHTVIRHVANCFRKLGASNRAGAVRLAGERGLIDVGMATGRSSE